MNLGTLRNEMTLDESRLQARLDRAEAATAARVNADLWVVGRTREYRPPDQGGSVWDFQGVYDSEEKAIAACRDATYWIAPAHLNRELPHESADWPGAYYPRR